MSVLSVGRLLGPPVLLVKTVTIRPPLFVSPARPGVKTVFENVYAVPPEPVYSSLLTNMGPEKVFAPSDEKRMMIVFGFGAVPMAPLSSTTNVFQVTNTRTLSLSA